MRIFRNKECKDRFDFLVGIANIISCIVAIIGVAQIIHLTVEVRPVINEFQSKKDMIMKVHKDSIVSRHKDSVVLSRKDTLGLSRKDTVFIKPIQNNMNNKPKNNVSEEEKKVINKNEKDFRATHGL